LHGLVYTVAILGQQIWVTWEGRCWDEIFFPPKKFLSLAPKISKNFIGMVQGKFLMAICDLKDIDNPG